MKDKTDIELKVPDRTLLLGYVGSVAHGTNIPSDDPNSIDDIDLMGVCVGDVRQYLGMHHFEQDIFKQGEWDSVVYEVKKYFNLLLKQNPNVISLLWLDEKDYVTVTNTGEWLLRNRDIFSSKKAYHSFSGYAYGQLHKMEHFVFEGYMGAKRKSLVEKLGYDAKNAAHLIRLLRMGIEFLNTGYFQVKRPDAEELKIIKTGGWTLMRIKEEASKLFEEASLACKHSTLPDEPDYDKAEKLLYSILMWELNLHEGREIKKP